MELNEFFEYKNRFMQELCSNENIVKLITDKATSKVPNRTLPYTQVYPYEYVPETVDNGQTFVCFDLDIYDVENKTFYIPVLYVWVFTHKSKMRLPDGGGVRTDALCVEINKLLDGSRFYGLGTIDLKRVDRFAPITDYHGRVMMYMARDFNRNGSKLPPSNRKKQ